MPTVDEDRELWLFLAGETYRQRGEGFRQDWSFHLWAARQNLGAPLARSLPGSQAIAIGGRSYIFQPFARDILYYEFPHFKKVRSLLDLLNGRIPRPGQLGFELLNQAFSRSIVVSADQPNGRRSVNQGWAFHTRSVRDRLGPALSPNYTIRNGAVALQVFPGDTLFSRRPPFADAEPLSALAPDDPLYTDLWTETYRVCGAPFGDNSRFHQEARRLQLGTPLSDVYRARYNDVYLDVQVFSRDTLYAFLGGEADQIFQWSLLQKPAVVDSAAIDGNDVAVPTGTGNITGRQLTSFWLRDTPAADARIRRMITLALRALGKDQDVLPTLTRTQRQQMQNDPDIVCADLVTMCWREAGVNLVWQCNRPPNTIFISNRAANYFRADAGHPLLSVVPDGAPLLPGDAFVYRNPIAFAAPGNWLQDEYHHVVIYVGPFAGTDISGRALDAGRNYEVVSASINSGLIDAFDVARARNPRTFGYSEVIVVRHQEIANMIP